MAKDPVDKLTHALCGLGRPFETLNSKRKLFYYHSVTPQYRTRGVNLLYAQRTAMPHSPTSDRCDQLIFRGNIINKTITCKSTAMTSGTPVPPWPRDSQGWAGAAPLHLIRFPNSKAVSIYNCSTNFLYFSSFAITSFARSSISSTSPSSASKIFSSS